MKNYIGLVDYERSDDGVRDVYGIIFPDFPGCVSAGNSFEEVLRMGAEALSAHVAWMKDDGDTIPEPSSLEQVRKMAAGEDGEWLDLDGSIIVMVPLLIFGDYAKRVNITIPVSLLEQIDAVTTNRSGFLAEAARQMLAVRG